MDAGSSADILYKSAFELMKVDQGNLAPTEYPLIGFTSEQVWPISSIELPVMAGTFPRQRTITVNFMVVDRPWAYNAIVGRTALSKLKAVTSTPHLCMKFPTYHGVRMVKGDQTGPRHYCNTSLKGSPEQTNLREKTRKKENT